MDNTEPQTPRHSVRKNIGQPPNRYGFESDIAQQSAVGINPADITGESSPEFHSTAEKNPVEIGESSPKLHSAAEKNPVETGESSPGIIIVTPAHLKTPGKVRSKVMGEPKSGKSEESELEKLKNELEKCFEQKLELVNKAHSEALEKVKEDLERLKMDETGSWADGENIYENLNEDGTPAADSTNGLKNVVHLMKDLLVQQNRNSEQQCNSVLQLRSHKDLITFEGDPMDWLRFYTDFKESTLKRGISNNDNLNRLQRALKGAALKEVRALMVHPDNINVIIERLKNRFGRPDLIIETLTRQVQSFKILKMDPPYEFINFASALRDMVVTIENLGEDSYLNNKMLMNELLNKLPEGVRCQWVMTKGLYGNSTNLKQLSQFLSTYAEDFCASAKPDKTLGKSYKAFVAYEPNNNNGERFCEMCKLKNHTIRYCFKFKNLSMEERWKVVKQNHLCFLCLQKGHGQKSCNYTPCNRNGCNKRHNSLLHQDQNDYKFRKQSEPNKDTRIEIYNEKAHATSEHYIGYSGIWLKVLPVILKGPKGEVKTYAFLDDGCTLSLMSEEVAQQLGLEGKEETMGLNTLTSTNKKIKTKVVNVMIKGANKKEFIELKGVKTYPNLQAPIQSIDKNKLREFYSEEELKDVKDYVNAKPSIIIGSSHAFIKENPKEKVNKNKPLISETLLGKVAFGPALESKEEVYSSFHVCRNDEVELSLEQLVKKHFELENIGIKVPKFELKSKEECRAEEIMQSTTKRVEGGWETGLLWKEENLSLPNNKTMVLNRLYIVEKRMDRDSVFAEKYMSKMNENFEKGFARPVNENDLVNAKLWYLPHFNAHNPKKPNKVRIVFDAAAKYEGVSLNDKLLKGPDLYNSLLDILLKFRQHEFAVSGDIKDFFPRIKIIKEDLPAQRFFYRGMERTKPPIEYVMESMIFGSTSSPSSSQYVRNLNAKEFESKYPVAVKAIKEKHFVDDYLDSVSCIDELSEKVKQIIEIHKKGGFTICNFMSNSAEVLQALPRDLVSDNSEKILNDSTLSERVLGLYWIPSKDILIYTKNFVRVDDDIVNGNKIPTKRNLLSLIASIYDPLGYIAHFIIRAKLLQRELWLAKCEWDDELPTTLQSKWMGWLDQLQQITTVQIPRCYNEGLGKVKNIQLHVFSDASEVAYAACAYLRFEDMEEKVKVALVLAKARVAPIKLAITIPKMELSAALLSSRLATTCLEALEIKIDKVFLWTDSTTVLSWLRSETFKFKQFVANRVCEILETTEKVKAEWKFVPTAVNVADLGTRDTGKTDLTKESKWFNGPEFLGLSSDQWPKEPKGLNKLTLEMKKEFLFTINEKEPVIEFERFSSFSKLVRVVTWILRVKKKGSKKVYLEASELKEGEKVLWKIVQEESFPYEMKKLSEGEAQVEKNSRIYSLSPVMEKDSLIRMNSRILSSPHLQSESKKPIILDSKHYVTKLLVQYYHEKFNHQGQETVFNELRKKYWILNARSAVRSAFFNCQVCRMQKLKPVVQEMGQIPKVRITKTVRSFINTGLDYFGPFQVTVKRSQEKRWVALFTCLVTRAVHLELNSLDVDSCIMAIRRFASRRGKPDNLYSDNGTNFTGADKELQRSIAEITNTEFMEKLTTMGIQWHFIPPYSPNIGGAWERLVKSVKIALYAALKEKAPKEEILRTLLCEAENIVNSRPITFTSTDPKDAESLSPNDFLIGKQCEISIPGEFDDKDLLLRKYWKHSQRMADLFWRKWLQEYLPTLLKRKKWYGETENLKVGDLVFIVDPNEPRGSWPRGIIVKTYSGHDGLVRVCDIKTQNGIYKRSISKIMIPNWQDCGFPQGKTGGSMSPPERVIEDE